MIDRSEKRCRASVNVQLAYTVAEACVVARAGRTAIYEAIRSGELVARKRDRKTIILADDLRLWIERLPRLERNPGQTGNMDTGRARA